MRHATAYDIFNNATGIGNQLMQFGTNHMQERNDLMLSNVAAKFESEFKDYIRDVQFKGDYEKYKTEMENFTRRWYDIQKTENNSAYYQRMIDIMKEQSLVKVRDHAKEQQDKYDAEAADIRFQEEANAFMRNMQPEEAFDAIINSFKLSKVKRPVSQSDEYKTIESIRRTLFENNAVKLYNSAQNVSYLDYIPELLNNQFSFMTVQEPVFDKDNNVIRREERPWTFNGREEWQEKQKEIATARIHKQNMENALTDNAQYTRLKEEWIRTGDASLSIRADRIADHYLKGEGVIAKLMKGQKDEITEYSNSDKDRLLGLFMPYSEKGVELNNVPRSQVSAYINMYGKELMKSYFKGETNIENGRVLLSILPNLLYDQVEAEFGAYPGGKEQFYKDNTNYFLDMETALMEVAQSKELWNVIPSMIDDFKNTIKTNQELQRILERDYAGRQAQMLDYFVDEYFDFLTSVNWNKQFGVTPEELQAGANEIIGRLTSSNINLLGRASNTNLFTGQNIQTRERNLAQGLAAMKNAPGVISTRRNLQSPVYLPGTNADLTRYERGLRVYATEAAEWVARSQNNMNTSRQEIETWASRLRLVNEIDVKRDEINPAAIFQLDDQGIFFRVRAELDARENPTGQILIDRQVTEGKNPEELAEDKWRAQTVRRNDIPESTLRQDRRENTERTPIETLESEIQQITEQLRNSPNSSSLARDLARKQNELRDARKMWDEQRENMISQISLTSNQTQKERLIQQALSDRWISREDAEKLRRGQRP